MPVLDRLSIRRNLIEHAFGARGVDHHIDTIEEGIQIGVVSQRDFDALYMRSEPKDARLHQGQELREHRDDPDARNRVDAGQTRAGFLRRDEADADDGAGWRDQSLNLLAPIGQGHVEVGVSVALRGGAQLIDRERIDYVVIRSWRRMSAA